MASWATYRYDADGEPRVLARFRSIHRCRGCRSWLSPSAFALSRILKRDYECRRCNTRRRNRERLTARARPCQS